MTLGKADMKGTVFKDNKTHSHLHVQDDEFQTHSHAHSVHI